MMMTIATPIPSNMPRRLDAGPKGRNSGSVAQGQNSSSLRGSEKQSRKIFN